MFNRKFFTGALAGFFIGMGLLVAADGTIHTWTGKGSRRNTVEMELRSATMGTAADLIPGAANANKLGTTSLYWKDVIAAKHGFAVASSTTGVTPDYQGQMAMTSDGVVYIATGTAATSWQKIGAQ